MAPALEGDCGPQLLLSLRADWRAGRGRDILRYISTRGEAPVLGFEDVLLGGPARDGGLYVPENWPELAQPSGSRRLAARPMSMSPKRSWRHSSTARFRAPTSAP